MKLSRLLENSTGFEIIGGGDPEISSIEYDSRKVSNGSLFAALKGVKADGCAFVRDSVAKGAAVVLAPEADESLGVVQVIAGNPRRLFAEIAARFYGDPSQSLKLVGITGTNGKTTIAFMLSHILRSCGLSVGMLGTIVYDRGSGAQAAPLTTPQSADFSRYLGEMVGNGLTSAVVEMSSHALVQERCWAHRVKCGVFTNLTRDHLDYHGDMQSYAEAKRKLFESLSDDAFAVINADDSYGDFMADGCKAKVIRFGVDSDADLKVDVEKYSIEATEIKITFSGEEVSLKSHLVGSHNASNCAAAVAAALTMGVSLQDAAHAVEKFVGVPGRLEKIESGRGVTGFVDYAHTDDALRSVLEVLKPLVKGKLIVVFGCGGDRDRGKRPLMAQAAEELADIAIVTNDNPRTEDPEFIVGEIVAGFRNPDAVRVILDREEAVREAASLATDGDVILLAGKGHEDYQIIGQERKVLDDRVLLKNAFGVDSLARGI